ncbi:MAG: DUF3240 family protein [Betaproteobacteria bacterium]|nr:DUF3240 family protein [Betaproteobacteria bacterium]
MSECCLTLLCPTAMEAAVIECLRASPNVAAFTVSSVVAPGFDRDLKPGEHWAPAPKTSIAVLLEWQARMEFFTTLRNAFPGVAMPYWIVPVIDRDVLR